METFPLKCFDLVPGLMTPPRSPSPIIRQSDRRSPSFKLLDRAPPPRARQLSPDPRIRSLPHPPSLARPLPPPATGLRSSRLCELSLFPGKGHGLTATTQINPGTLIIREKPFITFTHPILSLDIWEKVDALSARDRTLFWSFLGTVDESDPCISITETNAISLSNASNHEDEDEDEDDEKSVWSGMFEHISRANQSCVPNAGWWWEEDTGELLLHAYMAIPAGDEITCSYIDVTYPSAKRLAQLQSEFRFTCLCTACAKSQARIRASDMALSEFQKIRYRWHNTEAEIYASDRKTALLDIQRAIDILLAEAKVDTLAEAYIERFHVGAAWGMRKEAVEAARRARKHLRVTMGRKGGDGETVAGWKKDPKSADTWACCLPPVESFESDDSYEEAEERETTYHRMTKERELTKRRSKRRRTQ